MHTFEKCIANICWTTSGSLINSTLQKIRHARNPKVLETLTLSTAHPCFLRTLICQSKVCLLSSLWFPKLTATSGELSHTARPLPQLCKTL